MKKIYIYDTTLRDGAQGEGVFFSLTGKLRLAKRLDEFGLDYIEGGFAGSNAKEDMFFKEIGKIHLKKAKVVAFGSTRRVKERVTKDPFIKSLLNARTEAVAIFGKVSALHIRDVLKTTIKDNLTIIYDTVAYLKDKGKEVLFDAEHFFDGYKENADVAMQVLDIAVKAGADWLVLCDTNGGSLPDEVGDLTGKVVKTFNVPVGIHTHDDAGLGVANSLEAVRRGATMVQGTINGYGERCGNANLCTIIPNLELKMGMRCLPHEKLKMLRELSLFVSELANVRHDPKSPYVGESAFAHKGGSHVNAVMKNPLSYEHVSPEEVGNKRRNLISELSGGSNILLKAVELGLGHKETYEKNVKDILRALKYMGSKGYAFEAADASFKLLVQKVLKQHKSFFQLEGFRVIVEKRGKEEKCISEATVKVNVKGETELAVGEGDGPVNALDKALRKVLIRFYPEIKDVFLTDFKVHILDPEEATAAKTQVLIESSDGKETWGTIGVSENIIEASWEALVDSIEYKLFQTAQKRKGKTT